MEDLNAESMLLNLHPAKELDSHIWVPDVQDISMNISMNNGSAAPSSQLCKSVLLLDVI